MKRYSFHGHTADVRLVAEGSTREELFLAALEGMNSLLRKRGCAAERARCTHESVISLDAPDATALLVDFLSEALSLSHQENVVFCQVDFSRLEETSLTAIMCGCPVDAFDEDIKAVTYHEANIVQNEDGAFQTTIIFDI